MSLQIYSIPRVILFFFLRLRGWIHSSLLKVFFIWQILLKMWMISSDEFATAVRCGTLIWWLRPRSHAFPDCPFAAGQVANQDSTTPLPLLGSQWDEFRPSVWSGSLFSMLLLSWTLTLSCGQWCFRRMNKINKTGMCISKWCSPGCKRWTPSQQNLRHAYTPDCWGLESVHHPGRLGTALGEAVHCFQPKIPPINNKINHSSVL